MKKDFVDGVLKIVECTEEELFKYYLSRDWDLITDFENYKRLCVENGLTIVE